MKSYESPRTYIIWASEIGCVKEDITDWYFDKETGKFKELGVTDEQNTTAD